MSAKGVSRSRGPNFNKEEQLLLFEVLKPYTSIIECKKTDSVRQVDKQKAWCKITEVFNANTTSIPRSSDNLLSCYRNIKSKLKKQQSEAKMLLKDMSKKDTLLNVINDNGKDWHAIASTLNEPLEVCQESVALLEKEFLKEESQHKKIILGTGGGPPPPDHDNPLNALKKIIEPQMDGMFTIYDGDAKIMAEYQNTLPKEDRVQPIEEAFLLNFDEEGCNTSQEQLQSLEDNKKEDILGMNRTEILRKKRAPELMTNDLCSENKKKKTVNEKFKELSEEKLELVQLQKMSVEMDIRHKKVVYDLEIEIKKKELLLLETKIKKALEE